MPNDDLGQYDDDEDNIFGSSRKPLDKTKSRHSKKKGQSSKASSKFYKQLDEKDDIMAGLGNMQQDNNLDVSLEDDE